MTTSESKGRFFYKTNRFESIRITNRIDSNRELECSSLHYRLVAYRLTHTRPDHSIHLCRVSIALRCKITSTCTFHVFGISVDCVIPGVWQVCPQPLEQHFKSPLQSPSFKHASKHRPIPPGTGHRPGLTVKNTTTNRR